MPLTGEERTVPIQSPTTNQVLRDDFTWVTPGGASLTQTEVDFGTTPVKEASFTIIDATATATSKIIGWVSYEAPTGKDLDEIDMDELHIKCGPSGVGSFTMYVTGLTGYVADKFKINYLITN